MSITNLPKEIEDLRNKKLLKPKLYSYIEVRVMIRKIDEEWKAKIEKFENKLRDNHFIMTEELLEKLKEEKE